MELLDPRVDFVFKGIFGTEQTVDLLTDFVNAIFLDAGQPPVTALVLKNPFTLKSAATDRLGVLDIKARDASGMLIDVEIQVANRHDMLARSLFYAAKMITEQVHTGDDFRQWHKVVTINLVNFLYLPTPKDHVTLHLGDPLAHLVIPQYLEMHFLELPKWSVERIIKDRRIAQWMTFLTTTSRSRREALAVNDAVIERALKTLDYLSQDPTAREIYDQRLRELAGYLTDMRAERAEGREEGREEGRQEGREEGAQSTRLALARKLLSRGQTVETVAELVELSVHDIRRLLSNH